MAKKTKKTKDAVPNANMVQMPVTANQFFLLLRRFYQEANLDERGKLWMVLSALRGPDNDDISFKRCSTAVIRRKLLGKIRGHNAFMMSDDCAVYAKRRKKFATTFPHWHFTDHAQKAFEALGLDWNKSNGKKKLSFK